jgi:hypothetical protein
MATWAKEQLNMYSLPSGARDADYGKQQRLKKEQPEEEGEGG